MITIDYTYYTDEYKGFKVPSDKFDFYITRALEELEAGTPNATDDDRNEIDVIDIYKKCACEVSETLYNLDGTDNIASEKVGSHSITYKNNTVSVDSTVYSIISKRLGRTGLLNRGVSSVY